jgi:hypothetical protein
LREDIDVVEYSRRGNWTMRSLYACRNCSSFAANGNPRIR